MQLVCIAFSHKRTPINTLTHLWDRSPSDKYCHQPISRSLPFPLEPKVIVIAYDGTGWWWEADNQEVGVEPRLISLANADMLTQKQSSKVINGVKTEVVLQPFADRILILITQLGKVGNLVRLGKLSTSEPILIFTRRYKHPYHRRHLCWHSHLQTSRSPTLLHYLRHHHRYN